MQTQGKANLALVDSIDVEFDSALHARLDLVVESFSISQAEGEVARLSVSVLNPGIGLLAPGFSKYGLLSVALDGQPPKLMFRGVLNSMPVDIEEAMVTLEFFAQPDGLETTDEAAGKLELFAKSLSVRPFVEPLISGNTYRSPESVLTTRSATFYIDPVTHELSLNDLLDWDRLIDIGPWHERDKFSVAVLAPPLGSVTVTGIAEWTQEAKGTVDIASAINSWSIGLGGPLKSLTTLGELTEAFELRDGDGSSGWSIVNVEHTGLEAGQTLRSFKTGEYMIARMQKGDLLENNTFIETFWRVAPFSIYRFEASKFEMSYDYSQPRREILKVKLSADIQDIRMFGWKEEKLEDINLDSLVSDPSEPWLENTRYYVGDRVIKKDKAWVCQEEHDSGYDYFQKVQTRFENVPNLVRTADMMRWKLVKKETPIRDKRTVTFYDLARGKEVISHLVLRARALLRKRMRCLEATVSGRWEDLSDITLKDALRVEHDYFQTDGNAAIGKVVAFTKSWDGSSQSYQVDVTIGISAANGYSDLPEIDHGEGYTEAFVAGYAYTATPVTSQVSDVQFTVGGEPARAPIDPYRLGSAAYACMGVDYRMAYPEQLRIASTAEFQRRSPLKAVQDNPTTFEVRMRDLDGFDLITRTMTVTSTTVQGPKGIDLKWSG